MANATAKWIESRIQQDQITKYLANGRDFVDHDDIEKLLADKDQPEPRRVREIFAKALAIEALTIEETAVLLRVSDPGLLREMEEVAAKIKLWVYDNRIVTFAPLYLSSHCVNNCTYCGFRRENAGMSRGVLSLDQVQKEAAALAGQIGHKRIIAVYGEHPASGIDYITKTMETIYGVRVKTKKGFGQIRRINVNAAPMPLHELEILKNAGLGTYQVFQETYHRPTYEKVHPAGTLKSNYQWRLTSMHRALEAGIDDVGIGALFGLYDWRFEVMGMVSHAHALEGTFGLGPHTISFPRLEPAHNAPFFGKGIDHRVSDADFRRAIVVLRLAIPYAGMILTARETARLRRELIPLGITQADASTKIGVGAYSEAKEKQQEDRQQFMLGDTRSLDEFIRELAEVGCITSFCTAGYRCSRTGKCIMDLLKTGQEGKFCKLNAVLTFREWLDDFASEETKTMGEKLIQKEIEAACARMPGAAKEFMNFYNRISGGERDLYF